MPVILLLETSFKTMFKKTTLGFENTGVLNPLVFDYLNKNEKLHSYYHFFPDEKGFAELLKNDLYKDVKREQLVDILAQQSRLVTNTTENTIAGINKLKKKNTFAITTGHQLCLFTGPLYFIYKIISAINLAEELKKRFPEFDFVPVYWMASEDHDFEEINNFHVSGKTIQWESKQAGAVGDFNTEELKKILPQVSELFGISKNSTYLVNLFERTYLKHKTLADATRYLVNELFGEYGLVTIDGNDKEFKQQFKEHFKKDIFSQALAGNINHTIRELNGLGYHAQVNPRLINCFYLEKGSRFRIEQSGNDFKLVGTERSFTRREMEEIIEKYPERISPNVVLRPVYQQHILPNIAYVGGPGELAYWLEFKSMFDSLNVFFPVLVPRNFVTVINKATKHTIDKLNLNSEDFFKPKLDLIKELQLKTNSFFEADKEKSQISEIYTHLLDKVQAIDKTLAGNISAELKKTLSGIDKSTTKANRALKRKLETEINRLTAIKEKLFPSNTPQERYENFTSFYLSYGKNFIKELKEKTDPLQLEYILLTEE
jgi:bacillithiol biosynthesis cysteine-adding enzyme BshC